MLNQNKIGGSYSFKKFISPILELDFKGIKILFMLNRLTRLKYKIKLNINGYIMKQRRAKK